MATSALPHIALLEELVTKALSEWNFYTTWIAGGLIAVAVLSILLSKEADAHPYLLARQATRSPVRQSGESAVYRSLETPYGFPLRSGLNVRDANAPKWTGGRRGDLRDIWRTAVRGALKEDGSPLGKQGKVYTVLGRNMVEHTLDSITQDMNVVGQYLSDAKAKTVAICLTDSVELLTAIFAGAFYNFRIIIVPHNLAPETLSKYLQKMSADTLVAEAGSLDLSIVASNNQKLSHVIWVASPGNRHMDWTGVPAGVTGDLEVAVWHELVEEKRNLAGSEVPSHDPNTPTPSVSAFWPSSVDGDIVEFSSENLVAAIGALANALPRNQRFGPEDMVLAIDSVSQSYPFCQVMAALYANASVALSSSAGESVDFALATMGVSPTVIVASSGTMSEYHKILVQHTGMVSKFARWFQTRTLDAGRMPPRNAFSQLASMGPTVELSLDKLRLLCISHRADAPPATRLSYQQLTDLRIFTCSRIVYALTGPRVAGAITQTSIWDYRRMDGPSHFGAPVSSVEVVLTGVSDTSEADGGFEGQITVKGSAVVSGSVTLSARGRFRDDHTLELCS